LTHRSDELARRRQQLPWVRIDKAYRFETEGAPRWRISSAGARSYQWLDRAPRGRNEAGYWWRHHDSYD
jgi:predicted dithiol-disulfide oxidoreductase (DUF899 family)